MRALTKDWMVEGDQWWAIDTPVGRMLLAGNEDVLHHLFLPNETEARFDSLDEAREGRPAAVAAAELQVKEYFAGERLRFELPLDPQGTEFQRSVWFALDEIGYGETATYGEIAARVGKPTAFRAVGMTNGRNPIPLVLPCHRVIGSSGKLVGYGGGLALKQELLEHEARVLKERGAGEAQ
ncbi:MAG: methylated-DNA--[protein]-cysteine S-methyltransferase [Acidimicrobiales bacterium]